MSRTFTDHLARYGPQARYRIPSLGEAQMYCTQLAVTHYENFSVASVLLPRRLLRHFHNVYAYCRWADDLADETGGGPEALRLLRWWREQLETCYVGTPRHPVMVALKQTIEQFQIPREPFQDLLFAFEQDQLVKRYATFEQLTDYCRNSANPVGHLVLYLCEVCDSERAALSDHVCTALQLANFWQDVARDFDIGRVYLPLEDRQRFGYRDEDLEARNFTPAFASLMEFQVERTRDLFYRGFPLIERMPRQLQGDIDLFVQGGLGILRKIEKQGYDVWKRRPELTKWEKGWLVLKALGKRLWSGWRGRDAS
jgi:squalene synthase HpnC